MARTVNSPELSRPGGHYSHVSAGGGQLHISGQLPVTPDGQVLADRSFEEQVRRVLANLDACLRAGGSTREDLLVVRVYMTDMDQWPKFDRIYGEWIGEHRPARAVLGVRSLHFGAALEIEATALDKLDKTET